MMPVSVTRSRRNVDEKNPEKKVGEFIRFATCIPVFMYLTDYREYSLEDVITQPCSQVVCPHCKIVRTVISFALWIPNHSPFPGPTPNSPLITPSLRKGCVPSA